MGIRGYIWINQNDLIGEKTCRNGNMSSKPCLTAGGDMENIWAEMINGSMVTEMAIGRWPLWIAMLNRALVRGVWCWDCLFLIFSGPRSMTSRAKAVIFVRILVKSPKPETLRNLFQRTKTCSMLYYVICLYMFAIFCEKCDVLWKFGSLTSWLSWSLNLASDSESPRPIRSTRPPKAAAWKVCISSSHVAFNALTQQNKFMSENHKPTRAKSLSWISKAMFHNLDIIARHRNTSHECCEVGPSSQGVPPFWWPGMSGGQNVTKARKSRWTFQDVQKWNAENGSTIRLDQTQLAWGNRVEPWQHWSRTCEPWLQWRLLSSILLPWIRHAKFSCAAWPFSGQGENDRIAVLPGG